MNKEHTFQSRYEKEQSLNKKMLIGFGAIALGITVLALGSAKHNELVEKNTPQNNENSIVSDMYDIAFGDEISKQEDEYQKGLVREALIKKRIQDYEKQQKEDEVLNSVDDEPVIEVKG